MMPRKAIFHILIFLCCIMATSLNTLRSQEPSTQPTTLTVEECFTLFKKDPHDAKAHSALQSRGLSGAPPLIEALGNPNDNIRQGAYIALLKYDARLLPLLSLSLKHKNPTIRRSAILLFDEKGGTEPGTINILTLALKDSDIKVVHSAMVGLIRRKQLAFRKDEELMGRLLTELKTAQRDRLTYVINSICRMQRHEACKPLLNAFSKNISQLDALSLMLTYGELGEPKDAIPLIHLLKNTPNALARYVNIGYALQKLPNPACRNDLLKLTQSPDFYIRRAAIMGLGVPGWSQAAERLEEILENSKNNFSERHNALESLDMIGGAKAENALLRIFLPQKDPNVITANHSDEKRCLIKYAIKALEKTQREKLLSALIKKLKSQDPINVIESAETLEELGDKRAGLALLSALNRKDADKIVIPRKRLSIALASHKALRNLFPPNGSNGLPTQSAKNFDLTGIRKYWTKVVGKWEAEQKKEPAITQTEKTPKTTEVKQTKKYIGKITQVVDKRLTSNLGSKRGAVKGGKLIIYRGSNFIGYLKVDTATENQSSGFIESQMKPPQIGDNVTNRLN